MTALRYFRRARGSKAPAASRLGRLAVRALFAEAVLEGKPGLVSPRDSGAHADMTLATFYRSIAALRPYFPTMAALGAASAPWRSLQAHGRAAEEVMLSATGGVNTHRGAIFHLGLLCAAAGALAARNRAVTADSVCAFVRRVHAPNFDAARTLASHGAQIELRYGACGARGEAAGGYRSVRRWSLPAFRATLECTGDRERAAVQALFALLANVGDTNLLWRGGRDGLAFAQSRARLFVDRGGVLAQDWRAHASDVHRDFVVRRLSPGGCADLLAATLFLHDLTARP
jgi:triphosphoribosyl-dephospho-CoA synthase